MNIFNTIKSFFTRPVDVIREVPRASAWPFFGGAGKYGSGSKSPGGMSGGQSVVVHNHFTLRQKSRDAMYDSSVAHSIVSRFADTVVDTGLKLKPTPDYDLLAVTPEFAEEWSERVAMSFHLWAKSKKSHRPRLNTFYQNQHLYQKFQQRDNDIFVRLYYSKDKDLPNPLQVDFIDPNQISGTGYTSTYTQYNPDDGIIRDESGREIGYKVWYFSPSGGYVEKTIPAIGEKSGRIFMLHGFNPEYAGQGRGFPRLAHALQEFEQITDFSLSTIQKAISQASLVMAVENDQADSSNPLIGRVAGPVREYGSHPQPSASAANVTDEAIAPINFEYMPEATIDRPGSVGVFNLRKGDKLKYLADTSPSTSYDVFLNSFVSYLSASVGMPVEILLMKFNANYSASRAAFITFWRVAQIWRDEMAADFLDPTYEMWLAEEIAAGRVSAPGWSDPRLRAAWLCCEWAGAAMPNIDPVKTATADRAYVEMGSQTLDDVARNYNGSSGKSNRAKIKRQYEELSEPSWGWSGKREVITKKSEKDEEE